MVGQFKIFYILFDIVFFTIRFFGKFLNEEEKCSKDEQRRKEKQKNTKTIFRLARMTYKI